MAADPTTSILTRAEVESFLNKYWNNLAAKRLRAHEDCFALNSFIFSSSSKRFEPGRLMLLRRQREYMHDSTRITVQRNNPKAAFIGPPLSVASHHLSSTPAK